MIAMIVLRAGDGGIGRNLRSQCTIADGNRSCLDAYLIPKTCRQESIMGLAATLDNERLDGMLVEVFHELRQRTLVCQHDTLGVWAVPMADGQQGMFSDIGRMAYENGILLSTQLMGKHLGLAVGELQGTEIVIRWLSEPT